MFLQILHEQVLETDDTIVERDDPLELECDQTLTIVTSTGEVSVDEQLVETQDIHIEGAQVLEMGELGVVEASDRIAEGKFIHID